MLKKPCLKENGERMLPNSFYTENYYKHLSRYIFAKDFCKDKIVGDIACGVGYGTAHIAETGHIKKVFGIDVHPETIELAKKTFKNKKIDFICSYATALPFKDNFFDIIVSFETIEHVGNYEKYLEEVKRTLKPGGLYIVSTPNKKFTSPLTKKPTNPFHTIEWTPDAFKLLLKKYFSSLNPFCQVDIKKPNLKMIKIIIIQLMNHKVLRKISTLPIIFYRKLKKLDREPTNNAEECLKRFKVKKGKGKNPLVMIYVCKNKK